MSVFSDPATGVYHATPSCAPEGHDRLLAEFAVAAELEPCGVCQPREPSTDIWTDTDRRPSDVSREELVDAMDAHDGVPTVADELGINPTGLLRIIGEYDLAHRVARTVHDDAVATDGGAQ